MNKGGHFFYADYLIDFNTGKIDFKSHISKLSDSIIQFFNNFIVLIILLIFLSVVGVPRSIYLSIFYGFTILNLIFVIMYQTTDKVWIRKVQSNLEIFTWLFTKEITKEIIVKKNEKVIIEFETAMWYNLKLYGECKTNIKTVRYEFLRDFGMSKIFITFKKNTTGKMIFNSRICNLENIEII